jgi:hypothetical protein
MQRRGLLRLTALLLAATPAAAADHPLFGTKLVIKVTPTVSKAAFVAKMPQPIPVPTPGGSDDPRVHGARFKLFEVHGEKVVFDLPAEGWTANASETVFKFVNREAPGGGRRPCAWRSSRGVW